MPRLPDYTSLGTANPSASRPIASYTPQRSGLESVGAVLTQVGEQAMKKQDRLESAYAESALLRGHLETLEKLKDDPDYTTYGKRYTEEMAKVKANALGMLSANKDMFGVEADNMILKGNAQVSELARAKEKDYGQATLFESEQGNLDAYLKAGPETRARLMMAQNDLYSGAADRGYISREEAAKRKMAFATEAVTKSVQLLPPEERIKTLTPREGFDAAMQVVMKNEGGFTASDGASGAPAIYGINAKWFPDQFAEAKRLTDTQGEAAGKAYAQQFYQKEFWDKNGIGNLPADTQAIVFDGVINHRKEFADELIQSAKEGATPDKLLAMRRAEYQRLGKSEMHAASLPGWMNRLREFENPAALLPADKRAELMDGAVRELKAQEAEFEKADKARKDALSADLGINVSRGKAGYTEVTEAYKRGDITPARYESLVQEIDKGIEEKTKAADAVAKVSGGFPLDPKNKDDRKALNSHFDAVLEQWQGLDPAETLARAAHYSAEKGMVPDKVQSLIRSNLRGGNAESAAMAADTVRQIRNANPRALDDFAENDLRLAETVGILTDSGYTPQEAVTKALEAETAPKGMTDGRKAEFKEYTKKNDPAGYIRSKTQSLFTDDPDSLPAPMVDDFNRAAELEYERTGNMEVAKTMALNTISRVWGASRVGNSNRYMRYSPERIYGVSGLSQQENADWMNQQLVADLSKNAWVNPENPITPERLVIDHDPTSGERPAYFVSILGQDGVLYTQYQNGKPLRWVPDWETSPEGLKRKQEQQQKVDEARMKRNALR